MTLDGKDFYLGPHRTQTSQREYDRLVGEWQANGRPSPATRSLSSNYLLLTGGTPEPTTSRTAKPTGELAGIKIAMRHVIALYGKRPVTEFGPLN